MRLERLPKVLPFLAREGSGCSDSAHVPEEDGVFSHACLCVWLPRVGCGTPHVWGHVPRVVCIMVGSQEGRGWEYRP